MWVSIGMTVGIVLGLFFMLDKLPDIFSPDSHMLEVFKNSAIITRIAVYTLRLFVKLATSSFHLARDEKKRNMLIFFYLSLIKKKAVIEKEHAIILNSLFSRFDTGLLKGDSAPTMSGNVTELVQVLSKS